MVGIACVLSIVTEAVAGGPSGRDMAHALPARIIRSTSPHDSSSMEVILGKGARRLEQRLFLSLRANVKTDGSKGALVTIAS
jgi:hypothetical protein